MSNLRLRRFRPRDASGRPCLRGTGITVHTIAAHHLQGMTPDEILDGFPHATLSGIHAALATAVIARPVSRFIYFYQATEDTAAPMSAWERVVFSLMLASRAESKS